MNTENTCPECGHHLTACQQRAGADGLREALVIAEAKLTEHEDAQIEHDRRGGMTTFYSPELKAIRAALSASPASRDGATKAGYYWYDGTYLSEGKFRLVEVFRPCWVDANRQDLAWRYLDRSEPDDITENLISNCKGRFIAINDAPDAAMQAPRAGKEEGK